MYKRKVHNFFCSCPLGPGPLLLLPENIRIRRFNLQTEEYHDFLEEEERIVALDYDWDHNNTGLSECSLSTDMKKLSYKKITNQLPYYFYHFKVMYVLFLMWYLSVCVRCGVFYSRREGCDTWCYQKSISASCGRSQQ